MNTSLIPALNESLQLQLQEGISMQGLKEKLSVHINHLIQTDFERLVSLLYRIDVSEQKLKYVLQQNKGEDAGKIIADLIIDRQLQKLKSRKQHSKRDSNVSDEEKW